MTDLMKKIAPKRLFKVGGLAMNVQQGISYLDEGRLYAAVDEADAIAQAEAFWTKEMKFTHFTNSFPQLIDRVGEYRVTLVHETEE